MKIVIVGAGEVGSQLSETLSLANHDVTVIERNEEHAQAITEQLDVRTINDSGSSARALLQAGVKKCDFFLAVTSSDETNLVAASLGKALGAKTTFARVHDATYRDNSLMNHQKHFGIDHLVNPEALAAVELAKVIRNPGRVAVEDFGRGKIEVKSIEVQSGAKVIGQSLLSLKLPHHFRIGLVSSNGSTHVANANTVLQQGDNVTLFGHPDALFESQTLFDPGSKGSNRISIVLLGGSEIAISIVRLLSNPRFRIRIIESNLKLCRSLAESFPNVTIVHGEGKSLRVMEEEEVGSADFFVACTKDDEINIMTCLQAKKLGVKHTLLSYTRSDYIEVLATLKEPLGLEFAVSPRSAATHEVLRYIGEKPFIELESEGSETNCIIELEIHPKSKIAGKRIRDIDWPEECVIVGQEHNYSPQMPAGDDIIEAGDSIIAIISKQKIDELLKLTK